MKRKTIFPEDLNRSPFVEEPEITKPENLSPNNKVLMYYSGGGNAKMTGSVTNKTYIFKEGLPTEVEEADVEGFMSMTKSGTCCGGTSNYLTKLFERV